ncbi:hypothetical protein IFM89_009497, partial [Coptis chinensis]
KRDGKSYSKLLHVEVPLRCFLKGKSNHSFIPNDVLLEILRRLPLKSLVRFKCVSKHWCSSIEDPTFVYAHLARATEKGMGIIKIISDYGAPDVILTDRDYQLLELGGYLTVGVEGLQQKCVVQTMRTSATMHATMHDNLGQLLKVIKVDGIPLSTIGYEGYYVKSLASFKHM